MNDLKELANTGFQTENLTYWDHGTMVAARFSDLLNQKNMVWKLPNWYIENENWIKEQLAPYFELIKTYQQYHDIGKPIAKTIDDSGKIHYPNHANISADLWIEAGGCSRIGSLIRRDMECHLLRTSGALEFAKTEDSLILLITALCEIHANAGMFGGFDSDSFKIKWKRLDKSGHIVLNYLNKESNLGQYK